jgi:hypothetical protein
MMTPIEKKWIDVAAEQLLGRKIVAVRYLLDEEIEALGWDRKCVVAQLDDGNLLFPSQDDEGNGPGAWFTNNEDQPVLPVI